MIRRTLLLTICAGLLAAVAAGGASAKDGFKMTVTLDPVPPITQTPLDLNCEFTLDEGGKFVYVDCHSAEPNPYPPKDEKTVRMTIVGPNKVKLTAYPDGEVVATGRLKVSFLSS
jgi:hypothetical protein